MKGTSEKGRAVAKAAGASSLAQKRCLETIQAAVTESGYGEDWKRSHWAPGKALLWEGGARAGSQGCPRVVTSQI